MPRFLEAITVDDARGLLRRFPPLERFERIPAAGALGRVLARPVTCPEPSPAFDRALMDGYAVHAADTFGAGETAPAYLRLAGRIAMGELWPRTLQPGEAVEISTGGALPAGADAVAMVEHCREAGDAQVELLRPVAPGDNLLRAGADLAVGAPLLSAGVRLAPHHLLGLAAFGLTEVEVVARPRVGIVLTGDELVPVEVTPRPGQVRECNGVAIAAQVLEAGAEPLLLGRCPDEPEAVGGMVERELPRCDALLVSGGSSQGARDSTVDVLARFGPPGVLAHGLALAPGKPTIIAGSGRTPIIGLPGHPVSSGVVTRLLVHGMLRALGGERGPIDPFPRRARSRMTRPVHSRPGREEYVRVSLGPAGAEPLLKGSGAFSSLVLADGLVRIPLQSEGLSEGDEVEVLLL